MIKWLFCALFPILSFSQESNPIITTFSNQNGLPPLKIQTMAKDSSGYLWLASNLGLIKFDGKSFTTYDQLPNVLIDDIQVRRDGLVCIALLSNGIGLYNAKEDAVKIYRQDSIFLPTKGNKFKIAFGEKMQIYASLNGYGIIELDLTKEKYNTLLRKQFVNHLLMAKSDLIVAGDSIYKLNLQNQETSMIAPFAVYDMKTDVDQNLWYTNNENGSLEKLDLTSGIRTLYPMQEYPALKLLSISSDITWSTYHEKLLSLNPLLKVWQETETGSNRITALYSENSGRTWFSQDNKLHVIEPLNQSFHLISGTEDDTYTAGIQVSEKEFLFPVFNRSVIQIYDKQEDKLREINYAGLLGKLENPFDAIKIGNKIWIAFINGIAHYDLITEKFQVVELQKSNNFFRIARKLKLLYENGPELWIASLEAPWLFKLNHLTLKLDSISLEGKSQAFLHTAKLNSDGSVQVATADGFVHIDKNAKILSKELFYQDQIVSNFRYIDGYIDSENESWLLADGKIYRYHRVQDSLLIYKSYDGKKSGYFSENIDIKRTQKGDIVVLTSAGVKIYDRKNDDFSFYGIDEGFANVNRSTRIKSLDEFLFFLADGIYFAKTTDLNKKSKDPIVRISNFKVKGYDAEGYTFAHKSNDIQIEFVSVDLTKPLDISYEYQLSVTTSAQQSDTWISLDHNENSVYFPELSPGEYRFQVKAKNKFSYWGPPAVLHFEIRRPYWQRWWFIIASLIVLAGIFYVVFKRRVKKAEEFSLIKSRMAELENEALRAQMNPHFIFNSLNSIKAYIIDHQRDEAADYLTNFSELIRLILANSREKLIPLEKELYALSLYMDIEKIRLEQKFEYSISNSLEGAMIQPLTLQPFVENAIWHGIVHKKNSGLLKIDINQKDEIVEISIEDDGIGRAKSQELKRDQIRNRSYGILITQERLEVNANTEQLIIEDLHDRNGNACGTKVIIKIPYKTKTNV